MIIFPQVVNFYKVMVKVGGKIVRLVEGRYSDFFSDELC